MRDTIELAREAGFTADEFAWHDYMFERFEALVRADERNRTWTQEHWTEYERSIAAAEREACAKVCEQTDEEFEGPDQWDWHSKDYAAAIRERGNT
jgi:hypothetical protein